MPFCASANELFHVVDLGTVRNNVNQRCALNEAADVHKVLEARAKSGSIILNTRLSIHRSLP